VVITDSVALRPIEEGDLSFLGGLYGTTRAVEMALVPWSEGEKAAFIGMQFEAQHRFYRAQFSRASFDVILRGERPIGRLYVDRRDGEIRVIDIALLPEFRREGIGGALMRGILDEAAASGRKVTIHVERNNPALRLYLRLGFRQMSDEGIYWLMAWTPIDIDRSRRSGRVPEEIGS
jgi:ribosomal protein S18 acetylase RimI-like enzyme